MTETLFKETLIALRDQYDRDHERAVQLSAIYGSDINPNNNHALTEVIMKHLLVQFPDGKEDIEFFCYEQDFGRKSGKDIEELWVELVNNIEVHEEIDLTKYKRSLGHGD